MRAPLPVRRSPAFPVPTSPSLWLERLLASLLASRLERITADRAQHGDGFLTTAMRLARSPLALDAVVAIVCDETIETASDFQPIDMDLLRLLPSAYSATNGHG